MCLTVILWQVTRLADEAYPALNELSAAVSTLKLRASAGHQEPPRGRLARVQKVLELPYECSYSHICMSTIHMYITV